LLSFSGCQSDFRVTHTRFCPVNAADGKRFLSMPNPHSMRDLQNLRALLESGDEQHEATQRGTVAWERQSPDWRQANRQSGNWRSQLSTDNVLLAID